MFDILLDTSEADYEEICNRNQVFVAFFLQTQKRMTLLSNEENKEISLSSELSQASTEKVNDLTARCEEYVRFLCCRIC